MFRAVRSSFSPLFKAQVKSICFTQQHVKSQIQMNAIRLCTTKANTQSWYDTLDEAQQKRIRHIQNEVKHELSISIHIHCHSEKIN